MAARTAPKPRVLLLITLAEVGGAQSYVRDLVPGLLSEYEVAVAAFGPGPLPDAIRGAGAAYVPLRDVRRPVSPLRDVLGLIELWRLCRAFRPLVVHANSSKAGVLGRLAAWSAGVPVRLFTAHGWAFKASSGLASRLYRLLDRAMARLTTTVVCVSEEERLTGLAAGTCRAGRTVVIRNGVDVGAAPVRRHSEHDRPVRIVAVGRLAPPKDFPTLVRAVARLGDANVEVDVLGDGPDRAQLEAAIADLGLAGVVRLCGEVADVPARLALADVFCLPSRSEGLPISVLEAMAAGLPVVASAVGGVHEMVTEAVSGFLVPPGDSRALAGRLATLVASAELRGELGAAGRRKAEEEFSLESFRQAHLRLYRSVLAGRERRGSPSRSIV